MGRLEEDARDDCLGPNEQDRPGHTPQTHSSPVAISMAEASPPADGTATRILYWMTWVPAHEPGLPPDGGLQAWLSGE